MAAATTAHPSEPLAVHNSCEPREGDRALATASSNHHPTHYHQEHHYQPQFQHEHASDGGLQHFFHSGRSFHACDADTTGIDTPNLRPRLDPVPHQGPVPPKTVPAARQQHQQQAADEARYHQDDERSYGSRPGQHGKQQISIAYPRSSDGAGAGPGPRRSSSSSGGSQPGCGAGPMRANGSNNHGEGDGDGESADVDREEEQEEAPTLATEKLDQVQRVLSDIFDYYIPKRAEPRLTCARFKRVCEDSRLIDKHLSSAQVDVTFAQVCRGSPHMTLAQFRDGIVRLAATKYPSLPRVDAVWRIYEESLSSFASEGPTFEEVDSTCLAVLSSAIPALETLYKGYFTNELSRVTVAQHRTAAFQQAEQGFVQVLADFEVVPGLVAGAVAHAVFRKVTESRRIPEHIVHELQGNGRVLGRNFTFSHFGLALALAANKCFADAPALALHRLFEWMDSSKGRVVFSTACPGLLPPGAPFRLAAPWFFPAEASLSVGEEFRSTLRSGTVSLNSSGRLANNSNSNNNMNHNTSTMSSLQDAASPASNADLPSRSTSKLSFEGASACSGAGGGARGKSAASRGATQRMVASISGDAKRVATKIFAHYAALGDPLNRCKLNSLKFQRLLRDCGILKPELGAENFAPPARRRSRSSSVTAPRGDSDPSGRDQLQPDLRLPLRVFAKPFLSKVEADLIFVQAIKQQTGPPTRGGRAPGARPPNGTLLGTSGDSGASKQQKGTHMNLDAFLWALADVTARCGGNSSRGEGALPTLSLEELCSSVLSPLLDIHEGSLGAGEDSVQAVSDVMRQPPTLALLERCAPGLERLFKGYAVDNGRYKPHWDADSLVKFCQEFELYDELAYLSLQRIFQDCVQQENFASAAGEVDTRQLSFSGFLLALGMLSYKVYMGHAPLTPVERLSAFFTRVNSLAGLPGLSARLGVHQEPLLPLPPRSQRRSSSSAAAASNLASARPRYSFASSSISKTSPGEMSWAALMHAN